MSIDIREAKELNHKRKSDTLDEILKRLDVIEGKVDNLASDKTGKIDKTMDYLKSSVSQMKEMIYTDIDKRLKTVLLRVFQITGAIILCTPAVIVTIWWIVSLLAALFV